MKTTFLSVVRSHYAHLKTDGLVPSSNRFTRLRYLTAVLLCLLTIGVGNAWAGDPTYKTDFKATGGATGKGYVYAGTSNTATPVYVETSDDIAVSNDTKSATGTNKYYAWANAVRGSEFAGWTITGSNGGVTPTSGTASPITVTVTSNVKDGTNTGTATATWTTYAKVNVTYNPSEDGIYSVTYQYNSYNTTTKEITTGDAENLSRTITSENGAQTIGSYKNDVITLESTSGTFQGWYSDAGFGSLLSTANPYTYTAPTSGSAAVYPKYEHVDKYYGRLTASIAAVPYSMPGGGTIFVSKEEAGTGTYSADAQTVDNIGMGTTGLKYYLHAQPTDKRYVFRGWYSNPECTGTALSTSADYTYTFTSSSTSSASPTLGNVYAAFDFNLYYMQVEAEPAVPGLGMVLVSDTKLATAPEYTAFSTHAEQFAYAYRLRPTADVYLYAKPKYGYKLAGWYTDADCTIAATVAADGKYTATGSSTDPMNPTIIPLYAKFVVDDAKVNITYNIPDKTKGEYTASVLDIAEVDDDFVWTFTEVYNSADYTANTTLSQNKTDVLRLEAQPKAGYGVTSWTIAGAAKTTPSQLYETTGTAAATYGVTFGDAKPFLVCATTAATTGTAYSSLSEALANLGTNKKIVVVQNAYVPAGNYIIPNGVTLLVPYDEAQTLFTTKPGITKAAPSGQGAYCTLTLGEGANIKVNGAISVSAHQNKGQPYGGAVTGKYGKIDLREGANITLNSGSFLYCWGYITGAGSVDALNGSTVYEDFQITCWRGGSAASSMESNPKKVFPLAQYAIQNIEAKINFHYGSSEIVYTGVTISYVDPEGNAKIIGTSDCLFQLKSGSVLTRWFDASKDRQIYVLNGDATLGYVKVNISVTVDSRDYVLPLTNNMDITINSGTFTCDYDFAVLPGASITINEGAKVSLGSNCSMYMYDKSEWPEKTTGFNYPSNVAFCKVAYTDTKITTARTYANMADAKFNVNGTLEINKAMYTTSGGADISSSNGIGKITLKAAAGTETTTYQAVQDGKVISYTSIPITPAKLHNGDDSYTLTAGAVANDQFIYSKSQEKWLKNPKVVSWNANGGTTEASTLAYSEGSFVGELPAAYKDGCTLKGWYTAADGGTLIAPSTKVTANVTYYAHWTPKSYSITYRDQGGVAFSGTHVDSPTAHPVTHTFGTATALNGVVNNKTGYIFGGWYRTPSCSGTAVTSIAASECKNITLYAKWSQVCTVTVNVNNAEYGTVDVSSIVVPSGAAVTEDGNQFTVNGQTVTASPTEDKPEFTYAFTEWENLPKKITSDVTVTAVFAQNTRSYTITWLNRDNKELATTTSYFGGQPVYPDHLGTPSYTDAEHHIYEFTGWDPEIHKVNGADNNTYTAQYRRIDELDVTEEKPITVATSVTTTTVHVAGKLNVSASLTTTDLILEATPSTSGEIKGIENLSVSGHAYFDLTGPFNAKTWYAVAVPWEVDVPHDAPAYSKPSGIYAKNSVGYAPLALGKDIDLIYYDGAQRAKEGHSDDCWKYVEDASNSEVMHPGKAYMFYLLHGTSGLRFERKSGAPLNNTTASVEPYPSQTGNDKDANWNGIANPATFKAYMNTASSNMAQVYVPDEKRYEPITDMEQTRLIVGQPIFVQATESKTVVAYPDNTDYANHAPRRAKVTEKDGMKCEVRIAASGKAYTDRLFVQTAEGKADEYIIGEDLAKAGVSDRVAQLWVDRYDARLCVNTVAPVNNRAEYPLGISVPATGDYTITLANEGAEAEGIHVYLTLDGKPVWNLSYADYTAVLEKGTTGRYGLRLVRNAPQIATGIDEAVVDAEGNTRKVLINNHVFIIRGEKVYTMDGQLVK